jgi:hypothetical protein
VIHLAVTVGFVMLLISARFVVRVLGGVYGWDAEPNRAGDE